MSSIFGLCLPNPMGGRTECRTSPFISSEIDWLLFGLAADVPDNYFVDSSQLLIWLLPMHAKPQTKYLELIEGNMGLEMMNIFVFIMHRQRL